MDVWARKQDMNTKRAIHALAGMNDRLYAIGGNHLKGKHLSISGTEQKMGQDWYFFFVKLLEKHIAIVNRKWPSLPCVTYRSRSLSVLNIHSKCERTNDIVRLYLSRKTQHWPLNGEYEKNELVCFYVSFNRLLNALVRLAPHCFTFITWFIFLKVPWDLLLYLCLCFLTLKITYCWRVFVWRVGVSYGWKQKASDLINQALESLRDERKE